MAKKTKPIGSGYVGRPAPAKPEKGKDGKK